MPRPQKCFATFREPQAPTCTPTQSILWEPQAEDGFKEEDPVLMMVAVAVGMVAVGVRLLVQLLGLHLLGLTSTTHLRLATLMLWKAKSILLMFASLTPVPLANSITTTGHHASRKTWVTGMIAQLPLCAKTKLTA